MIDLEPTPDLEARVLDQPLWYAAYTCSRHEKQVAEQLQHRGVEYFLPLYKTIHRWRNGRHRVELPLFPSYIFVRIALKEKLRALEVPGLVRFVGFSGVPFPLSDAEIVGMRDALAIGITAEPHPYVTTGSRVEVIRGPLQGTKGMLLRRRGKCRFVLSLDLIMRSIVVDVDADDVVPIRASGHIARQIQ